MNTCGFNANGIYLKGIHHRQNLPLVNRLMEICRLFKKRKYDEAISIGYDIDKEIDEAIGIMMLCLSDSHTASIDFFLKAKSALRNIKGIDYGRKKQTR